MTGLKRPLVLVHGLGDSPRAFSYLMETLGNSELVVLAPHLPHRLGRQSLRVLAQNLNNFIVEQFGPDLSIDLLGFSMGGLISRLWLQQFSGARRTKNFISVGTPHQGTFTAQIVPFWLLEGVAEMKRRSPLIKELNKDISSLEGVTCSSFFCRWDLMVFPGWQAVLPIGSRHAIPVMTHKQLITNQKAMEILVNSLFCD